MTDSPSLLLQEFFVERFSKQELRQFVATLPNGQHLVAELPGSEVGMAAVARETVEVLRRYGACDEELFRRLAAARPRLGQAIEILEGKVIGRSSGGGDYGGVLPNRGALDKTRTDFTGVLSPRTSDTFLERAIQLSVAWGHQFVALEHLVCVVLLAEDRALALLPSALSVDTPSWVARLRHVIWPGPLDKTWAGVIKTPATTAVRNTCRTNSVDEFLSRAMGWPDSALSLFLLEHFEPAAVRESRHRLWDHPVIPLPSLGGESQLVVLRGPEAGKRIPLLGAAVSIGRDPGSDLAVPYDPTLSRAHARLVRDDRAWRLEPLGSRNDVRVGGQLVHRPQRLPRNALVSMGSLVMRLHAGRTT